jgi:methionine-rich copper-binding protein CopC
MMQRPRLSAALFALLLPIAAAAPAFAHSHPTVMAPAKDATVDPPSEVSIEFSEPLEPKFSSLALKDSKGVVVPKERTVADPADSKHLTLPLPALPRGAYSVHWIAVAPDSHRLEGEYTFTVK